MMIKEILSKRILRVRQKQWAHPEDYLTFDYLDGGHGPWAHLFSRRVQELIGEPTPQSILIMHIEKDAEFEEYTGPIDPSDKR